MVRFIRYWIERSMEDPQQREQKLRESLLKVQEGSEQLRERWAQPLRPKGFWNSNEATSATRQRLSEAEAYAVSPYTRALQEMDDKAQREASETDKTS